MGWSEWFQEPDYEGISVWVNADLPEVSMTTTASDGTAADFEVATVPIAVGMLAGARGGGGPIWSGDVDAFVPFALNGGWGGGVSLQSGTIENDAGVVIPGFLRYHTHTEVLLSQMAATYALSSGWSTERDAFPSPMYDMTEGVDYDIVPGKDPYVDEDAYVQYESADPNVLTGWADWNLTLETAGSNGGMALPGVTGLRVGYSAPITWGLSGPGWFSTYQGLALDYIPGVMGALTTTPYALSLAALGTMESWTIYQQPNWLTDPIPIEVHVGPQGFADSDSSTSLIHGAMNPRPKFTFRMPRWRYWKPGVPPLRQRARNDGLAVDGQQQRGRGNSLQSSARRGGRVYC